MVIQRIQTVYLCLAVLLLAVYPFVGCTSVCCPTAGCPTAVGHIVLIVCLLDALLTAIAIFRYRDLKRQISLCGVCALLTLVPIVLAGVNAFTDGTLNPVALWPVLLPVAAEVLQLLARRAIKADKRLLADSERIR